MTEGEIMAAGRIRKGTKGFQGVSMKDNWRTDWFKNEDTAQRHLDDHLDSLKGSKAKTKKAEEPSSADPHQELREQGASDVPPGGEDTGTRGSE
jgi:hypothetical protein